MLRHHIHCCYTWSLRTFLSAGDCKVQGSESGLNAWPYFTAGGSTEGTGDAITNTSQADGDAPMYATNRVGPAFLYDFGPINR